MMKAIKYFSGIFLLLAVISCKKEYKDTSFINNGVSDPTKLAVMYDITQDNTGLVTILPTGEGVTQYDVYYGDGTQNFVKVGQGKTTQHTYKEGVYNVKIVAHSVNGKTAEITKPLTVSFKAPEDLKTTISTNGLTVSISATALYETMFHVYYGDETTANPEPYDSFLQDQTATHTYASAGSYVVRIVALSGGVATTTHQETVVVKGKQLNLPLGFDDPNFDYTTVDFDGNVSSVAVDPANSANKVLKAIKSSGAKPWAGTTLGTPAGFASKVPITDANLKMTMRVYSPAAGLTIKLKLEEHAIGANSVETDTKTTVANQWETLTFNFANNSAGTPAFNSALNYDKATVFFDFGTDGSGKIFYADDLQMAPAAPADFALNFESGTATITDFEGGALSVVNNPLSAGINTSTKVAKMVKGTGATYAGSFITLDAPIDFNKKTFKAKVLAPAIGTKVLLKVENLTNGSISFEKEVLTTKTGEWEELSFDYSAINTANSYQKIVLIFDNGTAGDGSAKFTYYIDDIKLN